MRMQVHTHAACMLRLNSKLEPEGLRLLPSPLAIQGLWSSVFALSCNMLTLILLEMMGVMGGRWGVRYCDTPCSDSALPACTKAGPGAAFFSNKHTHARTRARTQVGAAGLARHSMGPAGPPAGRGALLPVLSTLLRCGTGDREVRRQPSSVRQHYLCPSGSLA